PKCGNSNMRTGSLGSNSRLPHGASSGGGRLERRGGGEQACQQAGHPEPPLQALEVEAEKEERQVRADLTHLGAQNFNASHKRRAHPAGCPAL
ncbi:hypothetical protein MRX96_056412, partial [Rhipicephalus microplus]